MSSTKRVPKSTATNTSLPTPVAVTKANSRPSSRLTSIPATSGNSSLLQSKAKAQSQEDLTKPKARSSSRNKYIPGAGSVSTSAMVPPTRRPFSSKEGQKTEKTREKNKTSSGKSNSGASTSSNGKSSLLMSRRSKENVYKSKAENDKSSMENKIKDLMALAKSKDSEIKSLKTKLDHMMLLLNKQQEDDSTVTTSSPKGEFTSLVKLSHEDGSEDASVGEMQMELAKLQDENMQLREQVDAMMLSMKSKEPVVDKALYTGTCQQSQTQAELDTFSNDDGLSSSLDDLASATSGDAARSASVSRSASTENLLDDVSTGGMTSSNPQNGCRGDDKSHEDGTSETSSVTVACLTERIHRMEESHISTHEELEATVQELTDLQKSVPELTIDNSRLKDEKDYLVKQLSIAEKKLTDQAAESKHLKTLLSDHLNEGSNHTDLKQQYVVLLNEREQLLQIQESVSKELQVAVNERKESQDLVEAFQERMRHLERELTQSNTEKSLLNKKLKEMKDLSEEQKEVVHRLRTDLNDEHLRLESLYKLPSGSQERSELVEGLKKENQELKENCLLLEEDFTQCQSENKILDARVAELEEEQEATDTQNKKDLSELSELIDRLQEDLRVKQASLDEANDTLFVMEDSVEQHIAVKKHDNHIIQRYQEQVSELKEERFRLEKEIQQLKKEQRNQSEEWKQFQADLQMAVIIANDMKAETQSEVARLREDNQMLDETVTKLRVENEQLRRKRISNVSATSASILEAAAMRQAASRTSVDISALRESYKRRASENSPGVQSLIKSFDNPSNDPANPLSPDISQNLMSGDITSAPFSPVKSQAEKLGGNITRTDSSPITATVSPVQRHHSISSITQFTPSPQTTNSSNKLQQNSGSGTSGRDKPDTSYSGKTNGSPGDVQQFSHLLRNSDKQEARKPSSDSRKQPLTDILDHLGNGAKAGRRGTLPTTTRSTPPSARTRSMSVSGSSNDPLASLARRYGGSKRNALLKWCQEKTRNYHDIDITNFSSSWSDGLALCGLLHSYLPAHIPYDSLQQTYAAANDDKTRIQLQAKNFRLAFAAAESVGIEPALTTDEMTTKERPDWQRVMTYVTEIYKYFET